MKKLLEHAAIFALMFIALTIITGTYAEIVLMSG